MENLNDYCDSVQNMKFNDAVIQLSLSHIHPFGSCGFLSCPGPEEQLHLKGASVSQACGATLRDIVEMERTFVEGSSAYC